MKPRIVFFGNERLATSATTTAPTLKALIEADYQIEAVIANHEDAVSRQKHDLEVGPIAQNHKIPVLLTGKQISLAEKLSRHPADLGIVVAFGRIIPTEVINLFPKGILNIHPSLLPTYRGPTPIEQAILDGATVTGVSIMKLIPEMDSGPVYAQAQLKLKGHESKQQMANQLGQMGAQLLIKSLPAILSDSLIPEPQSESKASYCHLITKADGRIDWSKPAEQLEREIRAYLGWPGSHTTIAGKDVILTKAYSVPVSHPEFQPGHIEPVPEAGIITVECGGGYLCIEKLKPAGKREMTAAEFLAGNQL